MADVWMGTLSFLDYPHIHHGLAYFSLKPFLIVAELPDLNQAREAESKQGRNKWFHWIKWGSFILLGTAFHTMSIRGIFEGK